LKEKQKPQKSLLFLGLILIAVGIASAVLLFLLQYEHLWRWYAAIRRELTELELQISMLENKWVFISVLLLLFAIKSFIPIYPTPTVCFLTGAMLPMYMSVPVNVIGFCVLLAIRYYAGKCFGAGKAWELIRKNERLRRLIEQDGKGNSSLLVILRLLPMMPVNTISGVYGSLNFGLRQFLILSVIGYMPKIISFTFIGRNVFDPLSAEFIVPIMIFAFASGVSLICVNGMWRHIEKTLRRAKIKLKKKLQKKGSI
jgi:uncharacterized membrane protein YdjX (TVP38/TMEM64 family)